MAPAVLCWLISGVGSRLDALTPDDDNLMGVSGGLLTNGKAKEATFHAVVTRADGSVEDLGQIAYWHKNPLRRWLWSVRKYLFG
jgi:hypothetical protein